MKKNPNQDDPLPLWEDFAADQNNKRQSDAWRQLKGNETKKTRQRNHDHE